MGQNKKMVKSSEGNITTFEYIFNRVYMQGEVLMITLWILGI